MTEVANPQVPLAFRFTYDGVKRIVDEVVIDGDQQQLIGREIRKNGKFSYGVKRFSLVKINDLEQVKSTRDITWQT